MSVTLCNGVMETSHSSCIICTHHYVTSPFALQDLGDKQREIGRRARAALGHPLTGKLDLQAPRAPQSSVTPIPHDYEWLLRDDSKLTAPSAANPFTCEGNSGGRGWLQELPISATRGVFGSFNSSDSFSHVLTTTPLQPPSPVCEQVVMAL